MEFIFSSPAGYRKFFVTADSKEQAIKRFNKAAKQELTNGFKLKDVPVIVEIIPDLDSWDKIFQKASS